MDGTFGSMAVILAVIVLLAMQVCLAARQPRVLAEHQRFDGDRNGHRRQPDAAQIDVVEVPEYDAVDAEYLALDVQLFSQDGAERLRPGLSADVTVELR